VVHRPTTVVLNSKENVKTVKDLKKKQKKNKKKKKTKKQTKKHSALKLSQICRRIELCMMEIILCFEMNL
jgi:tripartite-type tricarboxylate transporter receptor subunit TctC